MKPINVFILYGKTNKRDRFGIAIGRQAKSFDVSATLPEMEDDIVEIENWFYKEVVP